MCIESALKFEFVNVHMLILALSASLELLKFKKSFFRNYVILRNRGIFKFQWAELSHEIRWASSIAFITQHIYVTMRSSFNFVKLIFLEIPLVTWPKFFDFWLIFNSKSDDIVEILKSKLFNIHRNKVWN